MDGTEVVRLVRLLNVPVGQSDSVVQPSPVFLLRVHRSNWPYKVI